MDQKKVQIIVEKIIADVRRGGDQTLISFAKKFDRVRLTPSTILVSKSHIAKAHKNISANHKKAIRACADRIEAFHKEESKRLPKSWTVSKNGVVLGQTYKAVDSVGIYVPGGRFAYPSTVLMTAIPARIAGVNRIAMVTPPARLSDEILYAASIAGVSEIYQVGGPAGLAAIAVGTKTIRKVDLIVGPGNALVTEAKRQLFGEVGIDLLAGPSELVVLADDSAPAAYVAADLAAQAEHDPDSTGILISLGSKLVANVKKHLPKELLKQCRFIYQPNVKKAVELANQWAGEHVQVMAKNSKALMKDLKNGGTFFIGPYSPAVIGDYWAGPSHVLPTGRSARFGSGLSVSTFIRRSSLIKVSRPAFKKGWKDAHTIAVAEGLKNHAMSLSTRVAEGI